MADTKVVIATAGTHFLYLPLYFANNRKYFGLLPTGYAVEVDSSMSRTDVQAAEMLLNTQYDPWNAVLFAVCDPVSLLAVPQHDTTHGIVLAGLVTNTAFWAVDHRRAGPLRSFADFVVFDEILSFDEGTTSHRIAKHIRREANKALTITCVDMGKEILALTGKAAGAVALSPNVLEIDELLAARPEYDVNFEVASTPEFSNVLVTGLLSRVDVASQHPTLVKALLEALQRALLLVRNGDPEVVDYAADKWGKPPDRVRKALSRANACHVFPETLAISPVQWENAVRQSYESDLQLFDANARERAAAAYGSNVAIYSQQARALFAHVVDPSIRPAVLKEPAASRARRLKAVVAGLALFASFATRIWPPASIVTLLVASGMLASVVEEVIPFSRRLRYLHWALWLCTSAVAGFAWAGILPWPLSTSLLTLGVGGWLGTLRTALSAAR